VICHLRSPLSSGAVHRLVRRSRLCRVAPACPSQDVREADASPKPCSVNAPNWFFRSARTGSRGPEKRQTNLRPLPRPARRSGWVQTRFGRAPGELQNHSRRTGRTLRLTIHARQAVVRVPKSNTKYGGDWGKPRGPAAPRFGPSISESTWIRKGKIFVRTVDI
jgi:hypothetical protein